MLDKKDTTYIGDMLEQAVSVDDVPHQQKGNIETKIKKENERVQSFSPLPIVREKEPYGNRSSYRLNRLPEKPLEAVAARGRFPSWLHRDMPKGNGLIETSHEIVKGRLNTVCEEARCPNILECYSNKTATFLLLGKACTRACGFCDIEHSKTLPLPDREEPIRIVESARALGLKHIVLTMVARDDLDDGGSQHVAETVACIRSHIQDATCEVLVSDFLGNSHSLDIVLQSAPEIFNHNLETVRRLTPKIRHTATYERSLSVLKYAKENGRDGTLTKSGIMLGLGETEEEVYEALQDLRNMSVDIVTIGQYLQASQKKLPVQSFVHPDQFEAYQNYGKTLGIPVVYAGPFVRSSYNAALFVRHQGSGSIRIVESS